MLRERLSLKARALQWLAQREHSRDELRRKLLRVARAEQAARMAELGRGEGAASASVRGEGDPGCAEPGRCVDSLLDWLQQHRYLSESRFVESRVQARSGRYGNLRIRQELAQHGVAPSEETLRQLRESELDRARAVWQRKFGIPAADAAERARQMRFLAQRGFSADAIRKAVQGADDDGP
jgi:regulatory protein